MDYRVFAKDLLKRKNQLDAARKAITFEINDLESEKYSVKTASLNGVHITASSENRSEDRLISVLARIEDSSLRLRIVERELKMIDMGLSVLDEYQKALIEGFFISGIKGISDTLMERYYKERSCLYDDRAKALDLFTRAVYGVIEL